MEISKNDGAVFIYTLAAVFTGIIAVDSLGIEEKVPIFLVSGVLAALWTVYFKYSMASRFLDDGEDSDGGHPESTEIGDSRSAEDGLGE